GRLLQEYTSDYFAVHLSKPERRVINACKKYDQKYDNVSLEKNNPAIISRGRAEIPALHRSIQNGYLLFWLEGVRYVPVFLSVYYSFVFLSNVYYYILY